MNILIFANLVGDPSSGVRAAVPRHVFCQQQKENAAFVNLTGERIPGIENQFSYSRDFRVCRLPEPFCRPDLVVFHELYYPPYLRIARELTDLGIPYVIVPHGGLTREAQNIKRIKKSVANRLFFRRFFAGAAAIHYLTERERDTTVLDGKSLVAGNGIDIPDRKKETFCLSAPVLTYIGRMDFYHKGLDILLEAFRAQAGVMRAAHAELRIYGAGDNRPSREIGKKIREYGISDFVHLLPAVYGEDKKRALSETDLFVQTSRFEGMPMGLLEALAFGLPCLITEGTALGNPVADYGAGWAAPTSVIGVAEAIEKAMSSLSDYPCRGSAARKLAEESFRWETVTQTALTAYHSLYEDLKNEKSIHHHTGI